MNQSNLFLVLVSLLAMQVPEVFGREFVSPNGPMDRKSRRLLASLDGYEVLNGGDAVVCRDSNKSIVSVELLDVMESRIFPRGLNLELGPPHWTALDKARFAITRLYALDPKRAELYLTTLSDFSDRTLFLPNISLADVPDSHHIAIPSQCELQQIAIQISNIALPEAERLIINRDLWDLMDTDNQAALILHEIIYQEAIAYGHTTSFRTRYFNNFICSNRPKEIDRSRYVTTVLDPLGFPLNP